MNMSSGTDAREHRRQRHDDHRKDAADRYLVEKGDRPEESIGGVVIGKTEIVGLGRGVEPRGNQPEQHKERDRASQ